MHAPRVDQSGAAFAGSQLQTQLYVNKRTEALNASIRDELPGLEEAEIDWRSPIAADGYAEYWDDAFLKRVSLEEHVGALHSFWPQGGPHWDALAVLGIPGSERPGVLLVEGKSYPAELYGPGCMAAIGSPSRVLIEESLRATQRGLGIDSVTPESWCGRLYQNANRLAHLYWLRSLGVKACLVHLLFVADPHRPTTASQWRTAVTDADAELGLAGVKLDGVGHVLLEAGSREDLDGQHSSR